MVSAEPGETVLKLASFVVPSLAVAASLYSVFSSRAFEGVQASFSKVPSTAPPGPVTVALVMVPFSRLRVTGSLGRAASVEDVMVRAPAGATGVGEVSWLEDAVGVVSSGALLGVVFPGEQAENRSVDPTRATSRERRRRFMVTRVRPGSVKTGSVPS